MVAGAQARSGEGKAVLLLHGLGLLCLVVGLLLLRGSTLGADPMAALEAIAGQLSITLPAAMAVFAAAALNIAAGSIAIRWLIGRPYAGLAEATLAGLAGAVTVDLLLLAVLSDAGLFRWPILLAAQAAILATTPFARPIFSSADWRRPRAAGWWPLGVALIAVVWSAPLLLQLGSPVVPFMDVLPNHVAPVEHLRTFGGVAALDVIPSPIYGSSRLFLGYQATLGFAAAATTVPAVTAVAVFALPLALCVAAGGWALASAIGGSRAAPWALLLLPMTLTFLRLGDARAAVMAFPLTALVLLLLIRPVSVEHRPQAALLAIALAATIYVHPVQGAIAAGVVAVAVLLDPARHGPAGVAAGLAAAIGAMPQLLTTAGVSLPPWSLAVAGVAAAVVLLLATSDRVGMAILVGRTIAGLRVVIRAWRPAAVALGLALALALAIRPELLSQLLAGGLHTVASSPVLLGVAVLSLPVAARRPGYPLLWLAAGTALAATIAPILLLAGTANVGLISYEMGKTANYFAWPPLAVAGAVGLAVLWQRADQSLTLRVAIVGVLIAAATLPLRLDGPDPVRLTENRLSETLSISLRHAERGYWQGYPDSRTLVDNGRRGLIDALRGEIDAGRIRRDTRVLHVAASFQQWVATPLGVFTGVMETTASLDPEYSFQTEGGRLFHVADLPGLLEADFGYVVLEPAGLSGAERGWVITAGYEPIFATHQGEVFVRRHPEPATKMTQSRE